MSATSLLAIGVILGIAAQLITQAEVRRLGRKVRELEADQHHHISPGVFDP